MNDPIKPEDAWVQKFLVRLKKLQVCEALDRLANDNRSHVSLLVGGISQRQVDLTKRWVMQELIGNLDDAVKAKDTATEEAQGTWSVAYAPPVEPLSDEAAAAAAAQAELARDPERAAEIKDVAARFQAGEEFLEAPKKAPDTDEHS